MNCLIGQEDPPSYQQVTDARVPSNAVTDFYCGCQVISFRFYKRTISTAIHLCSHTNMTMPRLWVEANEPSIESFHKQVFHYCMSVPIT